MAIRKAAVIGYPVSHSISPDIHGYWLEKYRITGNYGRVELLPDMLQHGVQQIKASGYVGFNVTIPHKQEIMAFCDEIDEAAKAIGAVNTVIIKDKKLYGRNTDAEGFMESLREGAPKFNPTGAHVLVLGAGGAARAVIFALRQAGAHITVTNRTRARAETFGSVEIIDWADRASSLQDVDLLVNTTSLGMTGQPELDMNLESLPQHAVVCDIVYRPLQTRLLQDAAHRGNLTVGGLGMLLHQAAPAFEAWFGRKPEITDELRSTLERIVTT